MEVKGVNIHLSIHINRNILYKSVYNVCLLQQMLKKERSVGLRFIFQDFVLVFYSNGNKYGLDCKKFRIGFIKHWLLWNSKGEEMGMKTKFTYNTPWQIPLFDEQDDVSLIPHILEK